MGSGGIGVLLFFITSTACAQEWTPIDARSRALGGAGVAFADGRADSLYWNPATLSVGSEKVLDFSTGYSFSLSIYADAHAAGDAIPDVLHIIDQYDFYKLQDVQSRFDGGGAFTDTEVQNVMKVIDSVSRLGAPGEGALTGAGGGFNLRVGPFGLFAHGLGSVGVTPVVDLTGIGLTTDPAGFYSQLPAAGPLSTAGNNLSLALQAAGLSTANANNLAYQAQVSLGDAAISNPSFVKALSGLVSSTGPTSFYDNPSGVFVRGLAQVEVGLSFALPVLPTLFDIGVSIKDVISETSYELVTFADKDSLDNLNSKVRDDLKANRVRTSRFNADLGAWATPTEWLALGLSARNVIPMTVGFAGPGGSMHLDPSARFGAMVRPISIIKLGVDVDLLENESPVLPGYKTREFGAGVEFDFPVIKLRVGYDDNLAFSKDHGRLTAGLGLDFFGYFLLDFGAQTSLVDTVYQPAKLDGTAAKSYPTDRVSLGVTLGVNLPF